MANTYSVTAQSQLQRMFDTCIIKEIRYPEIDNCLKQIVKNKNRYVSVSGKFSIPWYVTGILHASICGCDFKIHLHNGDSLNGRTISIPIGFPKRGRPPFSWEQSAEDALQFYGLLKWSDWSIPGILYNLEIIRRDEYEANETRSLKLWNFSNHCTEAKESGEGKCGGAVLLRRMAEKHLLPMETSYQHRLADIVKVGSEVPYSPTKKLSKTCELQKLLNLSGAYLREDGKAGVFTANAYHAITNHYLSGDPEDSLLSVSTSPGY